MVWILKNIEPKQLKMMGRKLKSQKSKQKTIKQKI
jgi:hypothetical protein